MRGGPFCDARVEHSPAGPRPLPLSRWAKDTREALQACLRELPADLTGVEEGPLPASAVDHVERLAERFVCIQRHLDRQYDDNQDPA